MVPQSETLIPLEGNISDKIIEVAEGRPHECRFDADEATESLFHPEHAIYNLRGGE
jgi:hypothetical protein